MEQLATTPDATDAANSEIEAEVSWTVSNRPPEVILSFEGLHEPQDLWDRLTAIGWVIPQMPPRPANAIEWTPDPVAGTDFTVLPWRAADHKLEEGNWTVPEDEVGTKTLDALLDFESTIIGSSSQIAEHAELYKERAAARARAAENPIDTSALPIQAPTPTPAPAPAPEKAPSSQSQWAAAIANPAAIGASAAKIGADSPVTDTAPEAEPEPEPVANAEDGTAATTSRFILLMGFPPESGALLGAGGWKGISGMQKLESAWSEYSLGLSDPIPGHEAMQGAVAQGASAWFVDTELVLEETAPSGRRIVRLFLPDLSVKDAKVRRMNKLLGDDLESHQLRPLLGGDASAVLISAAVGANSFEMLKSNLCLRMPKAIIRVPA